MVEYEYFTTEEAWKTGRRIVELDTLSEGLKSCFACASPLYLENTVNSKNFGLASVLDIACQKCGKVKRVHTGRKHGKVYDMNTKLAIAMAHSGVGVRQINSILSALNIPPVNHSLLVRRQNEAGQALEDVAKARTEKYLQQEVNLN
ncbi:uncharacterized protein LOC132750778 [Ruditapes philippinarum]|uniref:uncharacterized protein LOC132750778 n=1 Tax=Ruditapes philippinarum TaxID=129788 RepID=UPI00295B2D6F|nr:uncharacterized protein LOC132750778 [Ruditapes philippinarum]